MTAAPKQGEILEALYREYNRREYVSPDPLEFLYHYDSAADREVAGLVASSLAYGRVASIRASVARVLSALGPSPASAVAECGCEELRERLHGFVHRFTKCDEAASFLCGIGRALIRHGSLERLFVSGYSGEDIMPAMESFAGAILDYSGLPASHLLPRPSKGSACKRLALYLRWMARRDDVDPGGWHQSVSARHILIPLDTHMFRISRGMGFTRRKSADGRAALETTEGFRSICPEDPARYDFALTRFGIWSGESVEDLLKKLGGARAERKD